MSSEVPNFRSKQFLKQHINSIHDFYVPGVIDENGGFFQNFRDDGSCYDRDLRHLVSSARFIFNQALWYQLYGDVKYKDAVLHGLTYLRERHRNSRTGGYVWSLRGRKNLDEVNQCYGLAFVLLAYAWAYRSGISEALEYMDETWNVMETHFWDKEFGLYKDQISADWGRVSDYRGQNSNMHSCEALLTAYEVSGEARYLERALLLAKNICVRQAKQTGGLIWEHYDRNWEPDWSYNIDDPKNLFRPWGFQPGHQTEWAKLLLILNKLKSEDWMVPLAENLFNRSMEVAWDGLNGGICYGFDRNGRICDGDKYFWVQAESFSAAARLAVATGNSEYWLWYEEIWEYCWLHLIDHKYGAWFRILTQDNRKYDEMKSPIGKTDYHTMGACRDVLEVLSSQERKGWSWEEL